MKRIIILSLTLLVSSSFANDDVGEYVVKRMIILNAFKQAELCQIEAETGKVILDNKAYWDKVEITKQDLGANYYLVDLAKKTNLTPDQFYKDIYSNCLKREEQKMLDTLNKVSN